VPLRIPAGQARAPFAEIGPGNGQLGTAVLTKGSADNRPSGVMARPVHFDGGSSLGVEGDGNLESRIRLLRVGKAALFAAIAQQAIRWAWGVPTNAPENMEGWKMLRYTSMKFAALTILAALAVVALGNQAYIPPTPVPIAPEPGQKVVVGPPCLAVQPGVNKTNAIYHFRVYPDDRGQPIAEIYTFSTTWNVTTPSGELPDGLYRWTCRCYVNGIWSQWFEPEWTFIVAKAGGSDHMGRPVAFVNPPTPVSPPRGTKGRHLTPKLVVSAPASTDEYHFCVWRGGGDQLVAEAYTTDPSWLVVTIVPELTPDVYSWSCQTRVGGDWSDLFQPYWYFEVEKPANPAFGMPPTPISPLPGTKGRNLTPTLVVSAPAGTDEYHFCVWRGDGYAPVAEAYTADPSWLVTTMIPRLAPDVYSWSCEARLASEWSGYFQPFWYFEIEKVANPSQDGAAGDPLSVNAAPRVYPNPCNAGGADIQLTLSRPGNVAVAVYSADGKLVKELAPSHVENRGVYQVSWDGRDNSGRSVVAGTYLCRIINDDVRSVVKITKSR